MGQRPPLQGYNHNIRYKVRVYHVQTEDSGLDNPHVNTHLFLDGMIVSSLRKSYVHLLGAADADLQVRKMMQEQHKAIMKQLRCGELDGRITSLAGSLRPSSDNEEPAHVTPPAGYTPPPLEGMSPSEARAVSRGTRISRVITPLSRQPSGEIPIPLDHPAFSAIPMLDWDESGDASALELDLEAINELDLDAPTRVAERGDQGGGVGEELDLDALLEDADDDAAEQALLAVPTEPSPNPVPLSTPAAALDWEPAGEAPAEEPPAGEPPAGEPPAEEPPAGEPPAGEPPAGEPPADSRALRTKHPSLPMPVLREEVDESLFQDQAAPGDDVVGRHRHRSTLRFPAPFRPPSDVKRRPDPRPTEANPKQKKTD